MAAPRAIGRSRDRFPSATFRSAYPIARSLQRKAGPWRGSDERGAGCGPSVSSLAISASSSRSSCLLFDFARVAVLARESAGFLAMNSSRCRAFDQHGRPFGPFVMLAAFRAGNRENASILPGYMVSLPRVKSSVWAHVAPKKARSCETIQARLFVMTQKNVRAKICVRKSRKFVGSSRSSKFGLRAARGAASLTRVCHPPEEFGQRARRGSPLSTQTRPATSPHFQSG